jgi:hypothetical protein
LCVTFVTIMLRVSMDIAVCDHYATVRA